MLLVFDYYITNFVPYIYDFTTLIKYAGILIFYIYTTYLTVSIKLEMLSIYLITESFPIEIA